MIAQLKVCSNNPTRKCSSKRNIQKNLINTVDDNIKDNSYLDNLNQLRKLRKDKINLYIHNKKPYYSNENSLAELISFVPPSQDIIQKILSCQTEMKQKEDLSALMSRKKYHPQFDSFDQVSWNYDTKFKQKILKTKSNKLPYKPTYSSTGRFATQTNFVSQVTGIGEDCRAQSQIAFQGHGICGKDWDLQHL